jgi:RNA polymerase sigma factor (sigma-70 family)
MAASPMSQVLQQFRRAALARDEAGLSDGQLLECYLAGRDEAAFEALVRRHGPMVLGVCRRVTGHAQDAEDAFQAAFLVLALKAESVRPRELVGNWLYGVACRTALKAKAASARRRAKERQVRAMPESRVESEAVCREWLPLLDAELGRLPEKYRVPVVLCELQGRSRKDVARQLGLPEGTLSSRLATARQLLAGRLSRRGVAVSAVALTAAFSSSAPAGVSPALITSTVQAAALAATGPAAMAGGISAPVVTLTQGVLKTMFLSKLKTVTLLILSLGVAAGIAGLPTLRGLLTGPANARATTSSYLAGVGQALTNVPANGFAPEGPAGHADEKVVGSGKPDTKKFDLADFTSLDVSSAFEVQVTKADKFSVSVSADDNLLGLVKVEKKDATLHVSLAEHKSVQTKNRMRAEISMPVLKGVSLSGACSGTIKGFDSNEDFHAKVDGASTLGGTLKTKNMKLEANGASKVKLQGSAKEATLSATGASHLELADFALDGADVHLSGASHAVVKAASKLDYRLSGASHLKYLGTPTIGKKEKSGASSASGEKSEK